MHADLTNILLLLITLISVGVIIYSYPDDYLLVPPDIRNQIFSPSFLVILIVNLAAFGIYHYTETKKAEFLKLQLQLQRESDAAEYNRKLLQQDENQRILVHDIKNHLQSIAELTRQQEYDKVLSYIEHLTKVNHLLSSVRVSDNDLLSSIVCRYKRTCDEKSISLRTDIRSKCIDFLTEDDMTALFCNLLDNAFESAIHVSDSYIELNVSARPNTSFVIISVVNSCAKNPFHDKSQKLRTTKKESQRHGFGLKSIEKIIKKYHGEMNCYFDDSNMTFHTVIMLTTTAPSPSSHQI